MVAALGCVATGQQQTEVRVHVSVAEPMEVLVAMPLPERVVEVARARTMSPPALVPAACGAAPDGDGRRPVLAQVALGRDHSCARGVDGSVRCWGQNLNGAVGDGNTGSDHGPPAPVEVLDLPPASGICTGVDHSCALLRDGTARCWGNNSNDQVTFAASSAFGHPTAATVGGGIAALACGARHTCALMREGAVRCWGDPVYRPGAVRVPLPGRAVEIAAGTDQSCARLTGGRVYCWRPIQGRAAEVVGLGGAVAGLAVGDGFACARLETGAVACWGAGYQGELGLGRRGESAAPQEVPGLSDVTGLVAVGHRACAVTRGGELRCWGDNRDGLLGTDAGETALAPVVVPGLGAVAEAALGGRHACARMHTGPLCCWGDNGYGQLGANARAQRLGPTPVVW